MVKRPAEHDLSQLIPLLSVFISSLRWIAPLNYGNHKICRQAEEQLSYILDAAIERQTSSVVAVQPLGELDIGELLNPDFLHLDSFDFLDPGVISAHFGDMSSDHNLFLARYLC